ncbi:LuxR C-terminal-related transcriptional regulator [Caulobacter sp. RL271]|uniref:LuxR C-terminal-related transcriptional regulator n=1 Tax=Caulobacter segnis TaxID=88688 RepID=A0ABY4ZWS9_9CAUL|nr:LuxR C-terminal-related transcriptional regulator [Caulobacter segnis]USQ97160.1 LuxR C-terminal-related transcriptional regulator [Caulobacter segnis]
MTAIFTPTSPEVGRLVSGESPEPFDSVPGLIAVFSASGDLEFANKPVFEFFNKQHDALRHWGLGGLTHPQDRPLAVECFNAAIVSGAPFEFEVRARHRDGDYRWLQTRGAPLRDASGRIVRWYNLMVDINDQKQAEQALREIMERSGLQLRDLSSWRNLYAALGRLSRREREVLTLIISGRLNKQVAGDLGISEITVKVHRRRLMRKMGARSFAELVSMATRLGLTSL